MKHRILLICMYFQISLDNNSAMPWSLCSKAYVAATTYILYTEQIIIGTTHMLLLTSVNVEENEMTEFVNILLFVTLICSLPNSSSQSTVKCTPCILNKHNTLTYN